MLFPDESFCFIEINAWPLLRKNFTILTQKIKPVEEWKVTGLYCQYHRLGFQISRRFIFPYHFKTNGMIFSDKSFFVFDINGLPLPPKIFTIRTQKIIPVEEWKFTDFNRQYQAGILGYVKDRCFRIILKRTECFSLTNLLGFFEIKAWPLPQKISSFYLKKYNQQKSGKIPGFIVNIIRSHGYIYTHLYIQP